MDIAAAQLLVRECGLAIELFEDPPFDDAPLDLAMRSRLAAASSPELVRQLAAALTARLSARLLVRRRERGLCRHGRCVVTGAAHDDDPALVATHVKSVFIPDQIPAR